MSGRHAAPFRPRPLTWAFAAAVVLASVGAALWWVLDGGPGTSIEIRSAPSTAAPTSTPSAAAPTSTPSTPPSPSPKTKAEKLRYAPTGHLATVPGSSPAEGRGPTYRYLVQVERGLPIEPEAFADQVQRVLTDRRGWGGTFKRVDHGAVAFRVVLASAGLTDRLCLPLQTNGIYSCFMNGRSVLNWYRWRHGASAYGDDLERYRAYMINHEVGHALGRGHASCPGSGRPAPIMMQQTKGVAPCRPNPWPKVSA